MVFGDLRGWIEHLREQGELHEINAEVDWDVEIGTVVKEGDPVCIIEAMKILNEIEADQSGTITQILAENGQAVEYGQPLFVIE